MAPRTREQFANMRQSRKESIMASALKLFANKGFKETSVVDIARDANVSKGLMYNYFTSKDELVREIIIEGTHKMIGDLDFDFTQKLNRERFILMLNGYFDLIKQNSDYWRLYLATLSQPSVAELVKNDLFEVLDPFIELVSQYYIEKGVKFPMAYAFLLAAIFDGVGMDYFFVTEGYPLDEIKQIIIEKFVLE
jgi:AcrR family transcriptional regulator